MSSQQHAPHRTVSLTGLIVCGVGVLVALGGLAFNEITAITSPQDGANIGAGLIVFGGLLVAAAGVVVLLVGLVMRLSTRHHHSAHGSTT